jgi:XTP/dITP diphosphohydrolase
MIKILYITRNMNKIREIEKILRKLFKEEIFSVEAPSSDIEIIEIQSDDLADIALYTLRKALEKIDIEKWDIIMREDSGLFIEALNGFPGPYSSYVYKKIGLDGILKLLERHENRRAFFKAVVAYKIKGVDATFISSGEVYGVISREARGSEGFGFDPIFIPDGYDKTFAELGEDIKIMLSHRTKAILKAIDHYLKTVSNKLYHISVE